MSGWSLNAAELRIPRRSRFAAHRMVVVADASGNVVRQLNGLASWYDADIGAWRHKPIGYLPSDRLRGYDTRSHPRTFMPINGAAGPRWNISDALSSGAVRALAEDLTREDIDLHLAPALEALRRINALKPGPEGGAGLPYPFLGFGRNSNSFFHTMLAVMGFELPVFANAAMLVPGAGRLLLPADEIAALRESVSRQSSASPSASHLRMVWPRQA